MSIDSEMRAQRASIISSIMALATKSGVATLDPKDPEDRSWVEEVVEEALLRIGSRNSHELKWADVKNHMHYDVYLARKDAEGGASAYDLVRPKLVRLQFSLPEAYAEHLDRIDGAKTPCTETKICSACGLTKLANKFRKGGGGKCNACRTKLYRQRKQGRVENES